MKMDKLAFDAMRTAVRNRILAAQREGGYFEGRLSDSALAAALASLALQRGGRLEPAQRGRGWLARNQNADGGWGDTPDSPSNLATTLLSLCSLRGESDSEPAHQRAEVWLSERAGGVEPDKIARAVAEFYGRDKTFSGPILSVCAANGLLGAESKAWSLVMQLPFEAAILPHGFYKWIRLPVVSYALPALIAIGLARHRKSPSRFLPLRVLRDLCAAPALRVLRRIQPESGGYLEAIPLTSFVALNLMAAKETGCPALKPCLDFLEDGQGPDGGWPIDTNLATWTTSLAARALSDDPQGNWRDKTLDYLLRIQRREIHPFTNADPGGWGWTHLSGSVPDADDTPAALLALKSLGGGDKAAEAARAGIEWLLKLQNNDGGVPTFCKGWMNLPFDQSCQDLTAHALAAFSSWRNDLPDMQREIDAFIHRALNYLKKSQRADGAWIPLWFGNQFAPNHENPVFGTARVVSGLAYLAKVDGVEFMRRRGIEWLIKARNTDGGWGGAPGVDSSLEETAMALSALAGRADESIIEEGVAFLAKRTNGGTQFPARPIGLYFSSLWYSEELYPIVFTGDAIRAISEATTIF
jgi:squalene-hopene/tetraprenyl-beta-curcumene cyclase